MTASTQSFNDRSSLNSSHSHGNEREPGAEVVLSPLSTNAREQQQRADAVATAAAAVGARKRRGKNPIFVVVDNRSNTVFADMVPKKGGPDACVAQKIVEDIGNVGYAEVAINIKSDQEVSMVQLER